MRHIRPLRAVRLVVLACLVLLVSLGLPTRALAATDAEQQKAANTSYIDHWAAETAEAWDTEEVYVAPQATSVWNEENQAVAAEAIREAEDSGATVRIALVDAMPQADRNEPNVYGADFGERLWQEIVSRDAQDRAGTVYYIVWDGRYDIMGGEMRDGAVVRELTSYSGAELFKEAPGPSVSYALRDMVEGGTEVRAEESVPTSVTGKEIYDLPRYMSSYVGAIIGWTLLGFCVLLLVFCMAWFPFRKMWRALGRRLRGGSGMTEENLAAMDELLSEAQRAEKRLQWAEPLPTVIGNARDRLPSPEATGNPLVWAAWLELADEVGSDSRRCFFRPDLEAVGTVYWDGLGTSLELPVSREVRAQLQAGKDPSFLSDSGIDVGTPYWQKQDDPFVASGFGNFSPLSAALDAAGGSWRPRRRRPYSPGARDSRSPMPLWASVAVVALLAVLAGTAACAWRIPTMQEEARYARLDARPSYAEADAFDTRRAEEIVHQVEESGVYVAPEVLTRMSPDDVADLEDAVAGMDAPAQVAVVLIDYPGPFETRDDMDQLLEYVRGELEPDTIFLTGPQFPELVSTRWDTEDLDVKYEAAKKAEADVSHRQMQTFVEELSHVEWGDWHSEDTLDTSDDVSDRIDLGSPDFPARATRVMISTASITVLVLVLLSWGTLALVRAYSGHGLSTRKQPARKQPSMKRPSGKLPSTKRTTKNGKKRS